MRRLFNPHVLLVLSLGIGLSTAVFLEAERKLSDKVLWIVAWALLAIEVVVAIIPGGDPGGSGNMTDKSLHFLAFSALTLAFLLVAVWRPARGVGRWPLGAAPIALGAVLLGAGIEVAQGFVGRDVEAFDLLADALGAIFALGLWSFVIRQE